MVKCINCNKFLACKYADENIKECKRYERRETYGFEKSER